jgi:hypothetical protein
MRQLLRDNFRFTLGIGAVFFGMGLALLGAAHSTAMTADPYMKYQLPEGVVMHIPVSGDSFVSPFVIACLAVAAICVLLVALVLWRKR